jgi:homoserine kinase
VSPSARLPDGIRVRLTVPATSANLGPAFDAAGLALSLYDDVEVTTCSSGCTVDVSGEGADTLPRDESHLVLRAARAGLDAAGLGQPGLALRATNRIPHGRGLGSSAAATVAGLVAAREIAVAAGRDDVLDDAHLLGLATQFEGHADNVGATLCGGLTLVWAESATSVRSVRLDVDQRVVPVVLVPEATLSTARARGLIPPSVPHRIAARNAGRAALLVAALTSRPSLLLPATHDWLHQPYRAGAFPESMALVDALRAEGHAATISGAGPSVLVLTTRDSTPVAVDIPGWRCLSLEVDRLGAAAVERPEEAARSTRR